MSGFFSSQYSKYEDSEQIPFYNEEFESELLASVGLGESIIPPSPGTPSNGIMSGNWQEDFPSFEAQELLPPFEHFVDATDYNANCFDFPEFPSADVKPEELEESFENSFESSEPSREDIKPYSRQETKRKRGRPMKSSSGSKMAAYSRQYREMKKKQLVQSESKADKLQQENDDLRAQLKEMSIYLKKLENEVQNYRRTMSSHQKQSNNSVPVMSVNQFY